MRFTRDILTAAASAAARWSETARQAGRSADAATLDTLREIAAAAAERFATRDPLALPQDADDAARVKRAGLFDGCVAAAGTDPRAEACPWTMEGICIGCGWKDTQWTFAGRRYECLTQHACRVQASFRRDA